MQLFNPIKISFKNLMAAKFRSFLTILGVIIGVASVIIIMAIGQSAQSLILDQMKGIGSNLVVIMPGASEEEGAPAAAMGINVTTLTYDDLKALKNEKNVPEVKYAVGYVQGSATVSRNKNDYVLSFNGTTASYIDAENVKIAKGRFFTEEEESNMSRVVVLGSKAAEELFENDDPLNQKIEIKDENFNVIGVFESRGGGISGSQDEDVFVPLITAQKILLGINHLSSIRLDAFDADSVKAMEENAKLTLRDRHDIENPGDEDFTIRDMATAMERVKKITDILRYFILAIGALSLFVGGIGIMNIMLIAANQRIKEIGTRKAVGARDSDIQIQFLVEASFISFLGGMIGIILGILVAFIISVIAQFLGYDWKFLISIQSIFLAVGISILIGIIFGMFPANRASKISPMEALRYE